MKPEIVIIGAAIIDILVRPASEKVFQAGTYPAQDIRMSTGADALNEATILARMGKQVCLEAVIGTDAGGDYLQNHCRECGIFVPEHCIQDQIPTGINVVLVTEDGERAFLTNDHGTLRSLTLKDIEMPFPESAKIICFASMFVFPHIDLEEYTQIFAQAKAQDKILCVDMTRAKHGETEKDLADALRYVDYLFPNEKEALLLTRTDTVEDAAARFLEVGVKNVIIKGGDKGCYVCNHEEAFWVPAREGVTCVDTTGAGDSFAAGFQSALLEGKPLIECARRGNDFGARSVSTPGATEWSKEL